MRPRGGRRGVSAVLAVTVVLAAAAGALLIGASDEPHRPPSADASLTEASFTTSSERAGGATEVPLDVTLPYLERVDTIYVIAEGDTERVVRSEPGSEDVGDTKRIAGEAPGNGGVDVAGVVNVGGDYATCVGDEEPFRLYAERDGETTLPATYTGDWPSLCRSDRCAFQTAFVTRSRRRRIG